MGYNIKFGGHDKAPKPFLGMPQVNLNFRQKHPRRNWNLMSQARQSKNSIGVLKGTTWRQEHDRVAQHRPYETKPYLDLNEV